MHVNTILNEVTKMDKKVISFSLWGDKKIYQAGAIRNIQLAKKVYPDFECWFYIHKETIPKDFIDELKKNDNVKIIMKSGDLSNIKPLMWRFETIDDPQVYINMSRDLDTQILLREKLAVDEWIKSDKLFHIMRDHPHHAFKILGGMFGTKKIPEISSWKEIMNKFYQSNDKFYDQYFLEDYIYAIIKNNAVIHSTFNKYESDCIPFPIPYCNEYKFVGEYVYEDDTRSLSHINALKEALITNKINLITSFYIIDIDKNDEKIIQRNNELLECLYKNLNNEYIEKIHLYVDNICALNKAISIDTNNKIIIANIGKQPTYYDMFKYSIDNLKNTICMISNSDIYLYKYDTELINNLQNDIYALSRHESNFICEVNGWGSHDAFIFKPCFLNEKILINMNHPQNVAGSDDNIINILCDNGYKLYNPCFQIVIIHLHDSNYRTYNSKKIADGKYFIKQEYLHKNTEMNSNDDFIYYHGLDHIDDDLYYQNNISIDQLKEMCKKDINCVGFNTLGFLKKRIDILNLTETIWINKNTNNGIYVKKSYL